MSTTLPMPEPKGRFEWMHQDCTIAICHSFKELKKTIKESTYVQPNVEKMQTDLLQGKVFSYAVGQFHVKLI